MTYKVLKSLVYGGIAYAEGQKVDIIEKSVAENCLERELIAEITDTGGEKTGDTAKEAVSSETAEEITESAGEQTKSEKIGKKQKK